MKNIFLSISCLLVALLVSCQKDELIPANESNPTGETGYLILDVGLSLTVTEIPTPLKSLWQTEDFRVSILREDGTEVMSFVRVADMPDTIVLEIGNYYAEAHSDNDLPAAFENPYYFGTSDIFAVNPNTSQTVLVRCELANTIVSVNYSQNIRNSFSDFSATVSSELDSLFFSSTETRWGYFRTLPLDISVELTYPLPDGSFASKFLSGNIPDPLPQRHYEVLVDATVDGGQASFQVFLDSSEIAVEVIEITDNSTNSPPAGIQYGDLLITEIMFNPSVLSDTDGEWFEIYNNSGQAVNLKNLFLARDDVNLHSISDSIVLTPGEFFVFERTEQATDAASSYTYGTSITLSNTGAILAIYDKGTGSDPGDLIFAVDYGSAGFPDPAGASISLNPLMFTASDALVGTSWCTSTSVYNTGDYGTPGLANDACQ